MFSLLLNLLLFLIVLFTVGFIAFFLYCRHQYTYWEKRGVHALEPTFPYGNMKNAFLVRETFGEVNRQIYQAAKASGKPHVGFFFGWRPVYIPLKPELLKLILTKDFHHFVDRGLFVDEEIDPLNANLFSLEGQPWKLLRQKFTPTFTSGKMKMMFHTLMACGDSLIEVMDKKVLSAEPVDIKDIMARFTTDVIGSCAFGIECNSLQNPDIEFRKYGKKIFEPELVEQVKIFLSMVSPALFKRLRIPVSNASVGAFFSRVVQQTVEYREKNNVRKKDFMHLLIQLKNYGDLVDDASKTQQTNGNSESTKDDLGRLTINQIIAQSILFFIAGFETSSSTLQFALYKLAVNKSIQERLRKEILQNISTHDGKLTYEGLHEIQYLDMVVSETLRVYPPVTNLNRVCTKEYKIPDSDVVLEKGTAVFIPTWAIQMDPDYFPEPEKFDPERFSQEEKLKRHPYTWLPFGEGPRNCIGMRFGLMQTKAAIALLVSRYKLTVNPKTKTPFKMDTRSLFFNPVGGIWIDVEKL